MADSTFIAAPTEAIAKRFSELPSRKQVMEAPELKPEPIPPPFSHEEISQAMEPLLRAIQEQQAPAPQPLPPAVSPLGSFVSALAGNLGSFLSRNPLYAQQVQENIQEQTRRRQAISQENYAQQAAFDASKQRESLSAAMQMVQEQLDEAVKARDADRAGALARNLTRLQTQLAALYRIPQETIQRVITTAAQGEQARATEPVKGAEARKTEETKGTEARKTQALKGEQELQQIAAKGEQAKEVKAAPSAAQSSLSMKDYLGAKNNVAKNPKIPDSAPAGLDAFMQAHGLQPRGPATKQEEAEMVDAGAVVNGSTPEVKNLASRNLKMAVARRLGIRMNRQPSAAEAAQINDEILRRYGLR